MLAYLTILYLVLLYRYINRLAGETNHPETFGSAYVEDPKKRKGYPSPTAPTTSFTLPVPCHFHSSSNCQRDDLWSLKLVQTCAINSTGKKKKPKKTRTGQYLISAEVLETVQTYRDNSVKLLPVLQLRGSWLVVTSLVPFMLVSNVLPKWC